MAKMGAAFSDHVSSQRNIRSRYPSKRSSFDFLHVLPLCFLIIAALIFLFRLFYVQVLRSSYYKNLSDVNRTRAANIPAPRGIIFDRNNKPLVRNSPTYKTVNGKTVTFIDKDEALERLAKGEKVENDISREYLYKDAFAHVLGYVGLISPDELLLPQYSSYTISDLIGKMGLERQYEGKLHGKNGRELSEVDATGKKIRFLGKEEAVSGEDLFTTLDVDMQQAAADAMKDVTKGAVIVSDPRDGGILALYSKPSFDPNLFNQPKGYAAAGRYESLSQILEDTKSQPFLNRAIGGIYPPGSTFKLITAIAALESRGIDESTHVEDTGILRVGAFSYGNWYFLQYGKTEGDVDIVKAVKRSNDIFFYKAAEKAGPNVLADWAQKFGSGRKLGIDLPLEAAGTVPTTDWKKETFGESWYLGDTYHYGIGQGFLLTTPLQVNFWTMPFANDGTLYKPHLIKGEKTVLRKNFFKSEYRELIRQGMGQSCEEGGVAWPLFNFKVKNDHIKLDGKDFIEDASDSAKMIRVKMGCKTGTAETTKDAKPHAWITAFAPFYRPEVVVTVLVENGGEGSSTAGPTAEKILRKYFEKR